MSMMAIKERIPADASLGWWVPSLPGAVLVMGVVTVFAPLIDGGTTHVPVMLIRLILIVTCSTWLLHGMRTGAVTVYHSRLWGIVGLFAGLSAVSLVWAPYLNPAVQQLLSLLTYIAFFILVLHGVRSGAHVRALILLVLGMGFIEGVMGIVQYAWMGEVRAKGTFFNPNFLGIYEVVTMLLALGLIMFIRREDTTWRSHVLLACTALVALCGLVVTQSRGALFALIVGMTFVGLSRYGKSALIVLFLVALGAVVLPTPMKQRVLEVSAHDPYAYTRFEIWENSLQRIGDKPWGVGLGMYKYASFQHRFPIDHAIVHYGKRAESAHSEYLQMGVELGLGGLVLFLIGVGMWGREAKNTLAGELPRWERGAVVGLCGGIIAIVAHAAVDSVFHEPAVVLLLVLSGGLVLVLQRLHNPESSRAWTTIPVPYHPARLGAALTLLAALAVLSIQPAAAWFAFEQGSRASQSGHSTQAYEWYQRAILIDSGTTAYRDAAALEEVRQFYQSGNPVWLSRAAVNLSVAKALNPLDGRFPYRLGTVYLLLAEHAASPQEKSGHIASADDAFTDAIRADPYSPFSYIELAAIWREKGLADEAQSLLEKALLYEPNFLPAKMILAKLAKEAGQTEVARSEWEEIREIQARYKGRALTYLEKQFLSVGRESPDLPLTQ